MNIGTWLYTLLHGRLVGRDADGNRYYQERSTTHGRRPRRWMMFKGAVEASAVGPAWHSWLHYLTDAPLQEAPMYPWQRPHLPNLTGLPGSYRPTAHPYRSLLPVTRRGYTAWSPSDSAQIEAPIKTGSTDE